MFGEGIYKEFPGLEEMSITVGRIIAMSTKEVERVSFHEVIINNLGILEGKGAGLLL